MVLARRHPAPASCIIRSRCSVSLAGLARTLRDPGIVGSMGSRGYAYDNAATESVMSTIKTELVRRQTFKTREQAGLAVFSYIEGFYYPLRRHSAMGYLSPVEFEEKGSDLVFRLGIVAAANASRQHRPVARSAGRRACVGRTGRQQAAHPRRGTPVSTYLTA